MATGGVKHCAGAGIAPDEGLLHDVDLPSDVELLSESSFDLPSDVPDDLPSDVAEPTNVADDLPSDDDDCEDAEVPVLDLPSDLDDIGEESDSEPEVLEMLWQSTVPTFFAVGSKPWSTAA